MNKLQYLIGSALEPIKKPALILHIVNDVGRWGSGFVLAISKKYIKPGAAYRKWYANHRKNRSLLPLGIIQSVPVEDDITIINMVAQHDIKPIDNQPPIRYKALEDCLNSAYSLAVKENRTVHMPRIGAVRSGGDWATIEQIIKNCALVDTFIYTLESEKDIWQDNTKIIDLS